MRDTLEENPDKGTMALVSGDRGYLGTLDRCLALGWEVEVYFWRQAAVELKKVGERPGGKFINLNAHFNQITFKEAARQ